MGLRGLQSSSEGAGLEAVCIVVLRYSLFKLREARQGFQWGRVSGGCV